MLEQGEVKKHGKVVLIKVTAWTQSMSRNHLGILVKMNICQLKVNATFFNWKYKTI